MCSGAGRPGDTDKTKRVRSKKNEQFINNLMQVSARRTKILNYVICCFKTLFSSLTGIFDRNH